MMDALQIAYYRIRKATTIEGALKQLVSKAVLREAAEQSLSSAELPARIAEIEGFDLEALFEELAQRLEMSFFSELKLPTCELIERTGHSVEALRSIPAIPQASATAPAGYVMVVSDPALISCREYRALGVGVALCSAQNIEKTWTRWQQIAGGAALSRTRLYVVLEQLAEDVSSCGGREVFIGHPDHSSYEFLAGGERYSGSINPQFFALLVEEFRDSMQFSRRAEKTVLGELNFALTKNEKSVVVYLSWTGCGTERRAAKPPEGMSRVEAENLDDSFSSHDNAPSGASAEQALQEDTEHGPAKEEPKERRVLIVDDDARFSGLLSSVLERKGYRVCSTLSAQDALQMISSATEPFDLLISDVHMPVVDGGALLRAAKSNGVSCPILMVTSDDDELVEAELVELGADAFVKKQEDIRVLLAWCKNLTARSRT